MPARYTKRNLLHHTFSGSMKPMSLAQRKKTIPCPDCTRFYKTKEGLAYHQEQQHKGEKKPMLHLWKDGFRGGHAQPPEAALI